MNTRTDTIFHPVDVILQDHVLLVVRKKLNRTVLQLHLLISGQEFQFLRNTLNLLIFIRGLCFVEERERLMLMCFYLFFCFFEKVWLWIFLGEGR